MLENICIMLNKIFTILTLEKHVVFSDIRKLHVCRTRSWFVVMRLRPFLLAYHGLISKWLRKDIRFRMHCQLDLSGDLHIALSHFSTCLLNGQYCFGHTIELFVKAKKKSRKETQYNLYWWYHPSHWIYYAPMSKRSRWWVNSFLLMNCDFHTNLLN